MAKFCSNCGKELEDNVNNCSNCGTPVNGVNETSTNHVDHKSKITAGILGIFLGAFGIHNFYL